MASGYDIGVSTSVATSFSTPQNTNAGAVFNFSSPGSSGDWYSTDQKSTSDATAVATAKSPDSPISLGGTVGAGGDGSGTGGGSGGGLSNIQLGIAAITLIAVVFFLRK